jgi:hypothetical protein
MKVPYGEGLASHTGPESCGDGSNAMAEALTGESTGQVLSRESEFDPGCRRCRNDWKATQTVSIAREAE